MKCYERKRGNNGKGGAKRGEGSNTCCAIMTINIHSLNGEGVMCVGQHDGTDPWSVGEAFECISRAMDNYDKKRREEREKRLVYFPISHLFLLSPVCSLPPYVHSRYTIFAPAVVGPGRLLTTPLPLPLLIIYCSLSISLTYLYKLIRFQYNQIRTSS
jgi:hypothetical protein